MDYIGVVKALRRAFADYTDKKGKPLRDPAPEKEKLLERIVETIVEIETLMKENSFVLSRLVSAVHSKSNPFC